MPLPHFYPEADSLVSHSQFPGHNPKAHRKRDILFFFAVIIMFFWLQETAGVLGKAIREGTFKTNSVSVRHRPPPSWPERAFLGRPALAFLCGVEGRLACSVGGKI